MSEPFTVLGQTVRTPQRTLETFPTPTGITLVCLRGHEVTSLCPVTGQPDFSEVTITYAPRTACLESKSLKLYLWAFREEGHFCEALAARICHDVAQAVQPQWCEVVVTQSSRGGIVVQATAEEQCAD